jgi:hypothetical protein
VCALFNALASKISEESFRPDIMDWKAIQKNCKNLENENQELEMNEDLIYGMLGPLNK